MISHIARIKTTATLSQEMDSSVAEPVTVYSLTNEHEQEVLAFLSARPIHTVAMAGFIRDNGLVSTLNRGTFYACRNSQGNLEGIALIGHINLIETRTDRALEAFARVAQQCSRTHLIMGEQERIEEFWSYYTEAGQQRRLACRELLFELHPSVMPKQSAPELRLATSEDLELVMPVQAQMAFEESGVNPMEKDPEGFRLRCLRRIHQGRTWVWVENNELIFKADIMADTPEVIYLEGIWVNSKARGQGIGMRCMSQLACTLLKQTKSICLLVNEQNEDVHRFYQKAGYKVVSRYDTIFLEQENS